MGRILVLGTWLLAGATVLPFISACRSGNHDLERNMIDLLTAAETMVSWHTLGDELGAVHNEDLFALVGDVNRTCERVDDAWENLRAYRDDFDDELFEILIQGSNELQFSCEGYKRVNQWLYNDGVRTTFRYPGSQSWVEFSYRSAWQAHQGCAFVLAATTQYGATTLSGSNYANRCWPEEWDVPR